jgi:polyketide cyclase/dehydrase/lipid transport protein
MKDMTKIRWPEHFEPSRCPVHVRNELAMTASAEAVWSCLVRAEEWPSFYPNSHDVKIEDGSGVLSWESRFRWRTFGVSLQSTVEELVPGERLAWRALAMGVDAYHAWLIEPRGTGCWVLTEETQHGWLARLGNLVRPTRMSDQHQIWLEGLQKAAARLP